MADELFPAFIKLRGRDCLVVGAGRVAESKINSLLRCGAKVRVIAPQATREIREATLRGEISWEAREFRQDDLAGAFLVIAATCSPELHQRIFQLAQDLGILCNCVDEPERCDFYYPAVVRRGPLQIAISTSGRAPVIAQQIRHDLEEQFGSEYGTWIEQIGRARDQMLAENLSPAERLHRLKQLSAGGPNLNEKTDFLKKPAPGKVFLIGAGPGDSELLTRKAVKCLESADVILHDALVPNEIVRLARPSATIINTGKRCGEKTITQQQINELMISCAQEGKMVVRLKGGDPLIFGRAGEEIAALKSAGIGFEIVPGVTAASAAAAAAQITLTDRNIAPKLILISGHPCNENSAPDWKALASSDATIAIYMPGGNYEWIARELQNAGLPGTTPCVVVSQAFRPQQMILRLDLDALAGISEPASPAILLVGEITRAEPENASILLEEVAEAIENTLR